MIARPDSMEQPWPAAASASINAVLPAPGPPVTTTRDKSEFAFCVRLPQHLLDALHVAAPARADAVHHVRPHAAASMHLPPRNLGAPPHDRKTATKGEHV